MRFQCNENALDDVDHDLRAMGLLLQTGELWGGSAKSQTESSQNEPHRPYRVHWWWWWAIDNEAIIQ